MTTVEVVTSGRADYGILLPVIRAMGDAGLRVLVVATGSHLTTQFGDSRAAIDADGVSITDTVDMLLAADTPAATASSIGLGIIGFTAVHARLAPDLVFLCGDRFEIVAAALAAATLGLPIGHLHGGEISEGAVDDQFRHAVTKLSHLHFVASPWAADRVLQMGEEPWRVTISGAPALDHLRRIDLLDRASLSARVGLSLDEAPLLVTYHPATMDPDGTGREQTALLEALAGVSRPIVFTAPNADAGSRRLLAELSAFVDGRPNAVLVPTLGTQAYFSLMAIAAAMVGNSSSGLIEAPSFALPVVNVGVRQAGRDRAANVIDVEGSTQAIQRGIARALSAEFRRTLDGFTSPFGDGAAGPRIARVLSDTPGDARLRRKHFVEQARDLAGAAPTAEWLQSA